MARLSVRVQPGSRHERLIGRMADGTLRIAVTAAPEGGRANDAVTKLLAATLGVDARTVTITRGRSSRSKVIDVPDVDESELNRRIEAALNDGD
jgi:uncharacterized protein YggU (UPF0235/DUF167 family)